MYYETVPWSLAGEDGRRGLEAGKGEEEEEEEEEDGLFGTSQVNCLLFQKRGRGFCDPLGRQFFPALKSTKCIFEKIFKFTIKTIAMLQFRLQKVNWCKPW